MTDDVLAELYHPRRERSFAADECFLCGEVLDGSNRTAEHVFPRWVLNEFDLWDQTIGLLNGSTVPYRQLTIPCCTECNTGQLAEIERTVHLAYSGGIDAFRELDRDVLFLWLAKILYALLVRELFLLVDRTKPDQRNDPRT